MPTWPLLPEQTLGRGLPARCLHAAWHILILGEHCPLVLTLRHARDILPEACASDTTNKEQQTNSNQTAYWFKTSQSCSENIWSCCSRNIYVFTDTLPVCRIQNVRGKWPDNPHSSTCRTTPNWQLNHWLILLNSWCHLPNQGHSAPRCACTHVVYEAFPPLRATWLSKAKRARRGQDNVCCCFCHQETIGPILLTPHYLLLGISSQSSCIYF